MTRDEIISIFDFAPTKSTQARIAAAYMEGLAAESFYRGYRAGELRAVTAFCKSCPYSGRTVCDRDGLHCDYSREYRVALFGNSLGTAPKNFHETIEI